MGSDLKGFKLKREEERSERKENWEEGAFLGGCVHEETEKYKKTRGQNILHGSEQ